MTAEIMDRGFTTRLVSVWAHAGNDAGTASWSSWISC